MAVWRHKKKGKMSDQVILYIVDSVFWLGVIFLFARDWNKKD